MPHIAARLDEKSHDEIECFWEIQEDDSIVWWLREWRIYGKILGGWAGEIEAVHCVVWVQWRLVLCLLPSLSCMLEAGDYCNKVGGKTKVCEYVIYLLAAPSPSSASVDVRNSVPVTSLAQRFCSVCSLAESVCQGQAAVVNNVTVIEMWSDVYCV